MDIHIAVEGRHDLAGQIYRQLRAGIVEGRLTGGTRLPSTRDLAAQLGVSRKTTLDVFERLLAEGYLSARSARKVCSGCLRNAPDTSGQLNRRTRRRKRNRKRNRKRARSRFGSRCHPGCRCYQGRRPR